MSHYLQVMIDQRWAISLLVAACTTIALSIFAFVLGSIFGALLAWARTSQVWVSRVGADLYITILRGIPELLVIYVLYFGGSAVLGKIGSIFGASGFIGVPALAVGSVALGFVSAAYQAEIFRGAYGVISKGEIEAAYAIGMRRWTVFSRIVAPQVMRIALPGLGNCWQIVIKESALVSVTGLIELLRQASVGAGSTREPFYFYMTAAAIYLAITMISMWFFDKAERHTSRNVRVA